MNYESKEKLINDIIQEIDKLNTLPSIEEENFKMGYRKAIYDTTYLYETLREEIERLNNNWNELEKWIKENDLGKYRNENVVDVDELLNKIQELKGSDKE